MKKKVWKFAVEHDRYFDIQKHIGKVDDCIIHDFVNGIKQEVGSIKNGWLKILKGYSWDGCTPKYSFGGFLLGIPDFQGTYDASLVHDFLIEYCAQHNISRKKIDKLFEKIMENNKFFLKIIYATGVHMFRPIAVRMSKCP